MKDIKEDSVVASNAVSGGGVEGMGYGPMGEPGGKLPVLGMVKRKLSDISTGSESDDDNLLVVIDENNQEQIIKKRKVKWKKSTEKKVNQKT